LATNSIRLKNVNYQGNRNSLPIPTSFPPQKISTAAKDESWKRQCIDSIIGKSNQSEWNGRSTAYRKQTNYNLVNSIFNDSDLESSLDPYGINVGLNSKISDLSRLQNFNIIRPKLERLKGEELQRPFNFMALGISGEVISVRDQYKQKMFLESFNQMIQSELQTYGMGEPEVDEEGNPVQPKTPKEIENYLNYSFRDVREKYANDIIKFLVPYRKLKSVFNKGWEHALISSEEIYYTGILGGHPNARVVNPINFSYDRSPDLEDIQDSQWCKEDRWLSIGQVLDEYRKYLTDDDIDALESGSLGNTLSNSSPIPGFAYKSTDLGGYSYYYNYNQSTGNVQHIRVSTVCWKSMRKIGFMTFVNPETGELEGPIMIDDETPIPKEIKKIAKIEWEWINEVYQGTKIGADIYVNVGPLPNQIKNPNDPSECKLPYVGKIYNALNSMSTSMVDLLKPIQYAYIVIWDRYLTELAKAKGNVMQVDVSQIPKSQGHDLEKYMYYVNMGFAFINSMEEGTEGNTTGQRSQNNTPIKQIDLSASSVIVTYMQAMDKLEQMAGELVGVNRQREGDVTSSENVSNVNTAISQSTLVTEYWFYKHNEVKEAVLTRLVELAKLCYKDGIKTQFFLDEGYTSFLDVDGELFNDSEYGVFLTNSSRDNQIKESLKGLAQAALQNDKLKFSDIIKIMRSDSIAEIENTIIKGEQDQQARLEQQQEADRQTQKDINNSNIQAQKELIERESQEKQLDRENKIEVATINTLRGKDGPTDVDNNGVIDSLEQSKLFLEQSKLAYETSFKEKELVQKSQADILKANTEKYKADISLQVAKQNKNKYDKKPKKKK
jgi:hypothetical protein